MWCRHCQQDVPGVAQAADGRVQCARCQRPLASAGAEASSEGPRFYRIDRPNSGDVSDEQPVVVEPWSAGEVLRSEDDQRLRELGRQLRSTQSAGTNPTSGGRAWRIDTVGPSPQLTGTNPPIPSATPPRPAVQHQHGGTPRAPSKHSQASAWFAALAGALVLGAGLGLLGWSLFGARPDLWNWGLGATLAGQGLLIVGLVQLLATLWSGNREANHRLVSLHYEIRRLQRTADGIAGARVSASSGFYADLARGASPAVLLANLKSQVDELASRYSGE